MGNAVVHFEINTKDAEALGKFCSDLFGWHTESRPELNYVTIDTHSGGGINGGFSNTDDPVNTRIYIEVPDLDKALEVIESLGGKTLSPPMEIPNIVTFAVFSDPQGNVLGLVKNDPAQEAPGVLTGNNPPVDWFEIYGKNAKDLKQFYVEAFGWSTKDEGTQEFPYFHMDPGAGTGIQGAVTSEPSGQRSVLLWAKVDDPQKYLDRASKLGAKTVMEPAKMGDGLTVAIFKDPLGVEFGIYAR
jgi:hypothetical protein